MHPTAPRHRRPLPRPAPLLGAVLAVLLALAVAACGGDDGASSGGGDPAGGGDDGAFPVTVRAANGEVEVEEQPERIVSLSASLTEMVYAVGAGDAVVAVDRFSDFPEGTPVTDLSAVSPNVEAIAGYDPDLVLLSSGEESVVDAIENLGVPVLFLPSAESLAEVYREITTIGEATGHADEAGELVEEMRSEIDRLVADVPERGAPLTYYFEVSDSYHSVTSDTFIGEVLGLAGLRSIADEVSDTAGGYPQLSAEAIVEADPDVIFIARAGEDITVADITGRPGWESMAAVTGERVVLLDGDVSTRWGPRIVGLLRQVVDETAAIR